MEQCSLMKPKCLLFLFLLGFGRLSPTVSSIDESNVASYEVERRSNAGDLFYVNTINVSQSRLSGWWSKFGPAYSAGGTNCGCTCDSDVSSFLPSLRRCLKGNQLLENLKGDYSIFTNPIIVSSISSTGLFEGRGRGGRGKGGEGPSNCEE